MKKSFTLIELLVLVAMIGILISLLMPSLNKARDEAKRALCLSNQSQSIIGSALFVNDRDNNVPYGRGQGSAWQNFYNYFSSTATNHVGLGRLVQENYISSGEIFHCPAYIPSAGIYDSPDNPKGGPNNLPYRTAYSIIFEDAGGRESIFSWQGIQIGKWLKMDNVAGSAVMVDRFYKNESIFLRHPKNKFNAAYSDGSAKSVVLASEFAGFNTNSSTAWNNLFLDRLPELR
ncbi:MAG: type II secretion system GspH family protein [Lentisphaeraceae bacterium]|nr:type II secretion system GspH family protein [Lentisphaeraceae bacterium]